MANKYLLLSTFAALMISGCAIGPDYQKPAQPTIAENFSEEYKNNISNKDLKQWWKNYKDENLDNYIDEALKNNLDINSSLASIEAMMGQFDQAKSYLYPQINANASMDKKGVKDAGNVYMLREGVTTTYAANLSLASYEIDFFGKVRRANEAARAMLLSSQYAYDTLKLSIIASVGASYFKLSTLDEQLRLAKQNIQITQDINNINKLKYTHGTIAQTTYLQSQAEYESAKATYSALESTKANELSTFNTLLGRFTSDVKISDIASIQTQKPISMMPSEVLLNRPDIALSEQQLIAANAKIGVAKAAYFPSFKLTGLLGVQSVELSDLIKNPARIWQIGPSISLPIFSAGRIAGEVKVAEAEYKQALATYQKSVISAINDTHSALVTLSKSNEQMEFQLNRYDAIDTALKQAMLAYKVGQIEYSDMLLVQQQWLQASQQYIISKQNSLIASLFLYKSLGGGWEQEQPTLSYLPAGR